MKLKTEKQWRKSVKQRSIKVTQEERKHKLPGPEMKRGITTDPADTEQ